MMAQLGLLLLFLACIGIVAWGLSIDPGDDPWIDDPDGDADDDAEDFEGEWIA